MPAASTVLPEAATVTVEAATTTAEVLPLVLSFPEIAAIALLNGIFIVNIALIGGAQYLDTLHKADIIRIKLKAKGILEAIPKRLLTKHGESYDIVKEEWDDLEAVSTLRSTNLVWAGMFLLVTGLSILIWFICSPDSQNIKFVLRSYGGSVLFLAFALSCIIARMSSQKVKLREKRATLTVMINHVSTALEAVEGANKRRRRTDVRKAAAASSKTSPRRPVTSKKKPKI